MKIGRQLDQVQHAWVVAGALAIIDKQPARAQQYFERARRMSSDLNFPYLEIPALASLVNSQGRS